MTVECPLCGDLWAEWNGKYRDTVRRYWKGEAGHMGDFAYRLCGSSDLYQGSGKTPTASINFVTAHDGYTLRDLVSFNEKHNQANGENNQDGDNNNHSFNWGHEGLDAPEAVKVIRRRLQRNFLATLFLSQGVPMIRGGDEAGATQRGNNNAYCQDNEISWLPWLHDLHAKQLADFTGRLIRFRLAHPIFHNSSFFRGRALRGSGMKDLTWFNADGSEMDDEAWAADFAKVIGLVLSGDSLDLRTFEGERVRDNTFLLYFNAHNENVEVALPSAVQVRWRQILDTAAEVGFIDEPLVMRQGGDTHVLPAHSVALFQQETGTGDEARNPSRRREPARVTPQFPPPSGAGPAPTATGATPLPASLAPPGQLR